MMFPVNTQPARKGLFILLVDDSPTDVLLAQEALDLAAVCDRVEVARDGEEAISILKRVKEAGQSLPDIVLLDLNMPKMDGRDVLREIKKDATLRHIPIIVLSTSQELEDVFSCYNLQANCFVSKPLNFDQFAGVVGQIGQFWSQVATLPLPS